MGCGGRRGGCNQNNFNSFGNNTYGFTDADSAFNRLDENAWGNTNNSKCARGARNDRADCRSNANQFSNGSRCHSDDEIAKQRCNRLANRCAKNDSENCAQRRCADAYKRRDDECNRAAANHNAAKADQSCARKDQKAVKVQDCDSNLQRNFLVKKYYEKQWNECNNKHNDSRAYLKDEARQACESKALANDNKECASNRSDAVCAENDSAASSNAANHQNCSNSNAAANDSFIQIDDKDACNYSSAAQACKAADRAEQDCYDSNSNCCGAFGSNKDGACCRRNYDQGNGCSSSGNQCCNNGSYWGDDGYWGCGPTYWGGGGCGPQPCGTANWGCGVGPCGGRGGFVRGPYGGGVAFGRGPYGRGFAVGRGGRGGCVDGGCVSDDEAGYFWG